MTAEIAILNRGAIALAADSAGTIGQGDTAKIYNGFNKIFELSEHEPVGIMIYGNLDFMGLPIESLVKRYRRQLSNGSFPHISGYMKDFLEFLAAVPRTPKDEVTHASGVLYQYFGALAKRAENRIFADIKERGKYLESKINQSIKDMIDAELKDRKADSPIPGYLSKMPAGAAASWTPVVEAAIDARFSRWQLTKVNRAALVKCGLLTLQKGPLSESRTGIVIAGFGADEFCPSLEAVETDGILLGKLKTTVLKQIDIGRGGPHAEMVGFAQDDMVSTFMNGVDPRYEQYVDESLSKLFGSIISTATANGGPPAAGVPALSTFFDHVRTELSKKLLEFRNKSFMTPIVEMIRFMPTQELATLAASMIDITSLKRRVSRDRETVGGEVDVAVISKAEGFVWIKRKHYFPPEINPRFFKRLQREAYGEKT